VRLTIAIRPRRPRISFDVSKVTVYPGDVVLVTWPADTRLDVLAVRRAGKHLKEMFPDNQVVMLADGLTLETVPRVHHHDWHLNDNTPKGENDDA
jgi:hypothetical protein